MWLCVLYGVRLCVDDDQDCGVGGWVGCCLLLRSFRLTVLRVTCAVVCCVWAVRYDGGGWCPGVRR
jgi:hypothetical protein